MISIKTDYKEKVRCQIVKLIFIIYWLLIFEGALRKWAFPQHSNILFFIKDLFVLAVYWFSFTNGKWPKRIPIFSYGMFLSILFAVLTLIQMSFSFLNPLILVYGLRNYFLYLPLVFIIGENFTGNDLKRLIRQTLFIAIPIAVIVYLQVNLPVHSFINKSVDTEIVYSETGAFGGSIARTTGTFTFFHGHALFLGSIVAFILAVWVLPKKERPLKGLFLYIATIAVIAIFAMDITRLPIFLAGFTIIGTYISGLIIYRKKIRLRVKLLPFALLFIALLIFLNFFYSTYHIKVDRLKQSPEEIKYRIKGMFDSFTEVMHVSVLGYGIGYTGRGAEYLGTNVPYRWAGEDEWRRIIAEVGPIFGLLYISYRAMLVIWLFGNAIKATRKSSNPLPIILISYIGPIIFIWYITHIGSVHGYGWLFAGFCAAANHLGLAETDKRSVWD